MGLTTDQMNQVQERAQFLICKNKHTHTHIHTHAHILPHTHAHTHTTSPTHTHIHADTHTHTHAHTHTHTHTYTDTHSHLDVTNKPTAVSKQVGRQRGNLCKELSEGPVHNFSCFFGLLCEISEWVLWKPSLQYCL